MNRSRRIPVVAVTLGVMLIALLLTACQGPSLTRSAYDNADWSRGVRLGAAALNDRVSIALGPSGDLLYLAWVAKDADAERQRLHFVQLASSGQILAEQPLNLPASNPSQVELVWTPQGRLYLFWCDRLHEEEQLNRVELSPSGALQSAPRKLALPGAMVDSYAVGLGVAGQVEILWSDLDGQDPGLYHLQLGEDGDILAENRKLREHGFDPAFRLVAGGRTHMMVWQETPEPGMRAIHYARFDTTRRMLLGPIELARFPLPLGLIGRRPALGLSDGEVYVYWSVERRGGGLTPPAAHSLYVSFPLDRPPLLLAPQWVHLPPVNHPLYVAAETNYSVTQLASSVTDAPRSGFIYLPSASVARDGQLAVAFAAQLEGRTKGIVQVLVTLWEKGALQGYQVAGRTDNASLRPNLAVDSEGDLYLVWIDTAGFGAYDVYYASTSPKARAYLNRITARDLLEKVLAVAMGVGQALSFLPMVLLWMLFPTIVLAVGAFIRPEGDLKRTWPRIMLAIAIVLYSSFKYLLRSNWLAALPLPRTLSAEIGEALTYAAPLLISGLAGLITWAWVRRHDFISLFPTFFAFIGVDSLLTLLIYIPSFLGE